MAEFRGYLIRHPVKFPVTLAMRLVKQLFLCRAGLVEFVSAESQQSHRQM